MNSLLKLLCLYYHQTYISATMIVVLSVAISSVASSQFLLVCLSDQTRRSPYLEVFRSRIRHAVLFAQQLYQTRCSEATLSTCSPKRGQKRCTPTHPPAKHPTIKSHFLSFVSLPCTPYISATMHRSGRVGRSRATCCHHKLSIVKPCHHMLPPDPPLLY